MPSFIHTGDLHLGRPFRRLGALGKEIRKAQFRTLTNIVDAVKQTRSNFLVVAGDLFDTNSVSIRLVKDVLSCFASIAPVPVYIQPGTHDVFDSASVYRTILNSNILPTNVTVIPEEASEFRPVPDVGLFASANTTKRGGDRPLRRLSSLASGSDARYKVAVIHGSVDVPGLSIDPHEPLVGQDEIASSPFQYVAMGHWHKRHIWSQGGTEAIYCGTPETLEFDEIPSPGTVTVVSLGDIVQAEERVVGTHKWVKVSLDLSLMPDANAIIHRANQEAGSRTLLRLELRGNLAGQDNWLDGLSVDDLVEAIGPNFFHAEIDASRLVLHDPDPGEFPPNSIGRAFHEIMAEKIDEAQDPAEKEILQEALRRGVLYLSGKAGIRP
ncbi:MAG TPA: DNA repair exonuclease [Firmicutes bacterium]|nr:DNA repair exonuclease [Candidatus Fermentithermobacillaceae bacterium]